MAASTSASLIRPRPVRLPSVLRSRSLRVSNMVRAGLQDRWWSGSARSRAGWCASSDAPRQAECTAGSRWASDTMVPVRPADRSMLRPPCATRSPPRSGATRPSSGSGRPRRSRSSGRSITRIALPLAAILVLGAGALEVAILRSIELVAALVFGLVAGAWVDRLRRRPVLIWADLGRAVLLGSIPVAFALGGPDVRGSCSSSSALAAVLTTFFDAADNAYLPTIVERDSSSRPTARSRRAARRPSSWPSGSAASSSSC